MSSQQINEKYHKALMIRARGKNVTENDINTLENRVFRLECEKLEWRKFRDLVETAMNMQSICGTVSESVTALLKEKLESIKYL